MQQGTITAIAATMIQDFSRTVELAEKEQAAILQNNIDAMRLAIATRAQDEETIQEKQREAAKLIKESIALKETADEAFNQSMTHLLKQGENIATGKLADASKLKLITSKRAA